MLITSGENLDEKKIKNKISLVLQGQHLRKTARFLKETSEMSVDKSSGAVQTISAEHESTSAEVLVAIQKLGSFNAWQETPYGSCCVGSLSNGKTTKLKIGSRDGIHLEDSGTSNHHPFTLVGNGSAIVGIKIKPDLNPDQIASVAESIREILM